MADLADKSEGFIQLIADDAVKRSRIAVENMDRGGAGECVTCGEYSKRLVTGICAPCRDRALIGYARKG